MLVNALYGLILVFLSQDRKRADLLNLENQRALQLEEEVKFCNATKCNKNEVWH